MLYIKMQHITIYLILTIISTIIQQIINIQYHLSKQFTLKGQYQQFYVLEMSIIRNNTLIIHTNSSQHRFYFYQGTNFQNYVDLIDVSSVTDVRYTDYGPFCKMEDRMIRRYSYGQDIRLKIGYKIKSNIISMGQHSIFAVQTNQIKIPTLLILNLNTYTYQISQQFIKSQSIIQQGYLVALPNNVIGFGYEYTLYIYDLITHKCLYSFNTSANQFKRYQVMGLSYFLDNNNNSLITVALQNNIYKLYRYNVNQGVYCYYGRYYNPSTDLLYRNLKQGVSLLGKYLLYWQQFDKSVAQISYLPQDRLANYSVIAVYNGLYLNQSYIIAIFNKQEAKIKIVQIDQSKYNMKILSDVFIGYKVASCLVKGKFKISPSTQFYLLLELRDCQGRIKDTICFMNQQNITDDCLGQMQIKQEQKVGEKYGNIFFAKYNNPGQSVSDVSYRGFQIIYNKFVATVYSNGKMKKNSQTGQFQYYCQLQLYGIDHQLLNKITFIVPSAPYNFKILYNSAWGLTLVVLSKLLNNNQTNDQSFATVFRLTGTNQSNIQQIKQYNSTNISFWKSQAVGKYIASIKMSTDQKYLGIFNTNFQQLKSYYYGVYNNFNYYKIIAEGSILLVVSLFQSASNAIPTDYYNFNLSQSGTWFRGTQYREHFQSPLQLLDPPNYFILQDLGIFYVFNPNQIIVSRPAKVVYRIQNYFPIKYKIQMQQQGSFFKNSPAAYLLSRNGDPCNKLYYETPNNKSQVKLYLQCGLISQQNKANYSPSNTHNQTSQSILELEYQPYKIATPTNKIQIASTRNHIIHKCINLNSTYTISIFNATNISDPIYRSTKSIINNSYFNFDLSTTGTRILIDGSTVSLQGIQYQAKAPQFNIYKFRYFETTRSGCYVAAGQPYNQSYWAVIVNRYLLNSSTILKLYFTQNLRIVKLSEDCEILALGFYSSQYPYTTLKLINVTNNTQINIFLNILPSSITAQIYFTSLFSSKPNKRQVKYIIIQIQYGIVICPISGKIVNCLSYGIYYKKDLRAYSRYGNIIAGYSKQGNYASIYYIQQTTGKLTKINYLYVNYKQELIELRFGDDDKLYIRYKNNQMMVFDPTPCPQTYANFQARCYCKQNFTQTHNKCQCLTNFAYNKLNNQCICHQSFIYDQNMYSCSCNGYVDFDGNDKICFKCSIFCNSCYNSGIGSCYQMNGLFYGLLFTTIILIVVIFVLILCLRGRRMRLKQLTQRFIHKQSNITNPRLMQQQQQNPYSSSFLQKQPDEIRAQYQKKRGVMIKQNNSQIADDAILHFKRDLQIKRKDNRNNSYIIQDD